MNRLNVFEIYPSIQGESTHAGRKCVFVRLAGCNLSCLYCDSAAAVAGPGTPMTIDDITGQVRSHGLNLVELTGGEPLIHPFGGELLTALCGGGFETLVETNGTVDIGVFDRRAKFIVDIKTPGSGAGGSFLESNFKALGPGDEVKFVITSREDFQWAVALEAEHDISSRVAVLFSPAHGQVTPERLATWLMASHSRGRLNLQLHKIIWGPDATGV